MMRFDCEIGAGYATRVDPGTRATSPRCCRAAFTLIELLVVMSIIILLMAVAMGAGYYLMRDSETQRTRMTVDAVVVAIELHEPKVTTITASGQQQLRQMWDLDVDLTETSGSALERAVQEEDRFLIDGDPTHPDAPASLAAVAPDDYTGFAYMTQFPADQVNARGEVVDAWQRPLRIVWSEERFPDGGFGVWSVGEDGRSDPFNPDSDDICSWRTTDAD